MAKNEVTPLMKGLLDHTVSARIAEVDHYRIRGGLAVESDYIVSVETTDTSDESFEAFTISKTFSSFRSFALQLKKAADIYTGNDAQDGTMLSREAVKMAKFCELVTHLINSQKTSYLGKVNFIYVQVLAKKRSKILEDILEATITYFPADPGLHPLLSKVAETVEAFFLTDHVDEPHHHFHLFPFTRGEDTTETPKKTREEEDPNPLQVFLNQFSPVQPLHKGDSRRKSVVVPITRRARRPELQRAEDEKELSMVGEEARLMLDDERPTVELVPSYSRPIPVVRSRGTKIGNFFDNNPMVFLLIAIIAIAIIRAASFSKVAIDGDIALLIIFAAFCLGLHTPRPLVGGFDRPGSMKGYLRNDPAGRKLLRKSRAATTPKMKGSATPTQLEIHTDLVGGEDDDNDDETTMGSPFPMFPAGAKIGSHTNCWSEPDPAIFQVRGSNYLKDKKKISSGDYLFPARGLDLFLTDACPENVGRNPGVFGGHLRELPTFIINFRLPWGVLLAYYQIPAIYIPFIRACYEPNFDKTSLPSLDSMGPGERTACRFLMNDMSHKNKTLKIVPIVAAGPWVVRQAVGGKPAIIGNKLPINYVYQPAEGNNALYLEADLDIAASSAARGILSLVKSYTQIVTIDLGFVVQGNEPDELPEQMLVASRIHGIEPLTAPVLPSMHDELFIQPSPSTEDDTGSVTPMD